MAQQQAPGVAKAAALWARWQAAHAAAVQALSLATNIHSRLPALSEPASFAGLAGADELQQAVLGKQLVSFNTALGVVHEQHAALKAVVKDMERLAIEAVRALSAASSLAAVAQRAGPSPSPVEVAELLQDMWAMCRDELLLKVAALSLATPQLPPADMAALLQCYRDQPNVEAPRVDAMLALLNELAAAQT